MHNETVKVVDLTTGYEGKHGKKVISRGICETLCSGELTCLLGPNGAGKSTLLKTLCGFIPPLGGEILIEGKPLHEYSDRELAGIIGIVLTDKVSLDNMTVAELVEIGRSPYTGFWGRLSDNDRAIASSAIDMVGIGHLNDRLINSLSDGERQKVMIAKALAQQTPVIFLDEPTAFLDYPSKVEMMQLLQRLSRTQGKTVFLSTHDLELALQIADKVWLVDKGKDVVAGTPEDLSLSGDIDRFFSREGVTFDKDTGLFRIDSRLIGKIGLKGEGSRCKMVKRALARIGIEGVDPDALRSDAGSFAENENDPQSFAEENVIIVKTEGFCFNGRFYSSVGELIAAVKDRIL